MGDPEMMFQVTLYSDKTLTIDGRAATESVPTVLRIIADAIESGSVPLIDMPLN